MIVSAELKNYMKVCQVCTLGAFCFLIIWAGTTFILPLDLLNPALNTIFFEKVNKYQEIYIINQISFIFVSLSMIGIVLTFFKFGRSHLKGILSFISYLGIVGFSVSIVTKLSNLFYALKFVSIFAYLDPTQQSVIALIGFQNFDYGVLTYGATGIWFFWVSYIATSNNLIPKHLSVTSLLVGFMSIGLFIAEITQLYVLSSWLFLLYIILLIAWTWLEFIFIKKILKKTVGPAQKKII